MAFRFEKLRGNRKAVVFAGERASLMEGFQ